MSLNDMSMKHRHTIEYVYQISNKHFLYMKIIKIIFAVFCLVISLHAMAQPFRYQNAIFTSVDTLKNVEYATAPWLNNPIALLANYNIHEGENSTSNKPLFMDIFMPNGDTLQKRPAIIFAHSGGFLLGTRHNDDMVALCDSFARRGYVTATIDYRLGMGATVTRFLGIIISIRVNEINGYRAFYRAMQDSRAAIRFLKLNAAIYGIDSTKIYFTGSSSGAILSIQNLYLDRKEEVSTDAFSAPSLGEMDDVGEQGFGAKANAIVAMWGALQDPGLIEKESTPVLLIHGVDDDIVPFKKGMPLADIVPPNPAVILKLSETYGSFCVDTALNNRAIFHETYFVEGKKHEFYGVDTGEFPTDGPNAYWDTVQWKMSTFLFNQFRPKADFDFNNENLTASFTNTSSEIYEANWDFGDGTSGTGNQVSHNYSEPGIYSVKIAAFNQNLACDTVTKKIHVITNSLLENTQQHKVRFFPNPASQFIHIEGITKSFNVKIYSSEGRLLFIQKNITNNQIDVNHLFNGLYILEIDMNEKKILHKFVKDN